MPDHSPNRRRRALLGSLCVGLLGATGAATYAYVDQMESTSDTVVTFDAADRDPDRASRDLARTPTATPSVTATPSPKPTAAPRIEKTTPPPPKPTRTVTTQPNLPPAKGCGSYSGNRLIACNLLPSYGWTSAQMPALDQLWTHESGWNPRAENPSSGAYGIPQALPGSKMATAGDDWATNARTQIRWGLGYIKNRYGSPASAWSFWQAHNWY